METPILLYDGNCVLCNWAVKFLIRHERAPVFRFAPLESDIGQKYRSSKEDYKNIDSIFVITADRQAVLVRTEALMYISLYMNWPWRGFRILGILPKGFRDMLYDLIARYRYKIWGEYEHCMIPGEISALRIAGQADNEKTRACQDVDNGRSNLPDRKSPRV